MFQPFLKVVVDNKEEGKFRQRALNSCPKERIEALWGYVRGDTAYICAFMRCELKSQSSMMIKTVDDDLDNHEDDAAETVIVDSVTGQRIKLELLGTIHTHPDCDDAVLSEHDIRDCQNAQEPENDRAILARDSALESGAQEEL